MQQVPNAELDMKIRKKVVYVFGSGAVATLFVLAVWLSLPL
jgi:hypothetical protein